MKITVFCSMFSVIINSGLRAAFIDPGWGTRGAGKGGAYVASPDDASSVRWNPATLAQIFMREGMFSYNKPYAGLDGINMYMGYTSIVWPVYGIANFGISLSAYDINNLYKENIYQFSAAKDVLIQIPGYEPIRVAGGVNLKYLYHSYNWDSEIRAIDDPIVDKDGAGALTADIGILIEPRYELPIGLTVKNIIPADVGLVYEDIVPVEIDAGIAYRMGDYGSFEEVLPEIRIGFRDQEYESKINYSFGIESWFNMHTIAVRTGVNDNELALGASYERYLGNIGIRFDYAAILSFSIADNFGSHRISTSIKF